MKNNLYVKVTLTVIAALLAANLQRKPTVVYAQQNHSYSMVAVPDKPEGSLGNRRLASSFQAAGPVVSVFCPAFTAQCYALVDNGGR